MPGINDLSYTRINNERQFYEVNVPRLSVRKYFGFKNRSKKNALAAATAFRDNLYDTTDLVPLRSRSNPENPENITYSFAIALDIEIKGSTIYGYFSCRTYAEGPGKKRFSIAKLGYEGAYAAALKYHASADVPDLHSVSSQAPRPTKHQYRLLKKIAPDVLPPKAERKPSRLECGL